MARTTIPQQSMVVKSAESKEWARSVAELLLMPEDVRRDAAAFFLRLSGAGAVPTGAQSKANAKGWVVLK